MPRKCCSGVREFFTLACSLPKCSLRVRVINFTLLAPYTLHSYPLIDSTFSLRHPQKPDLFRSKLILSMSMWLQMTGACRRRFTASRLGRMPSMFSSSMLRMCSTDTSPLRLPRCQVLLSKPSSVVSMRTFEPRLNTLYVSLGQTRDISGTQLVLQQLGHVRDALDVPLQITHLQDGGQNVRITGAYGFLYDWEEQSKGRIPKYRIRAVNDDSWLLCVCCHAQVAVGQLYGSFKEACELHLQFYFLNV
uniref:Uncharacterized protein n=1 Tax=Anopheles coluzzii TaxID=1518534 RepID=A0A8W7P9R6_ANOCL